MIQSSLLKSLKAKLRILFQSMTAHLMNGAKILELHAKSETYLMFDDAYAVFGLI